MAERIIPQEIIEHGWEFYTKCNCNGVLKYKFHHPNKPGKELRWLVKYMQFNIVLHAKVIIHNTNINKLNEILETI